ncbi:glycosyltransferase [Luedemannella helvata]|uniref:glycosyltransferase n=1 Tax=Luedemannella helvata TaxID=349315 RepID=UPI0031D0406B
MLIWKSGLLPYSETFIRHQLDALRRYRPVVVGTHRVDSPMARGTDVIVYGDRSRDRLARRLFVMTGRSARIEAVTRGVRPDLVHAHFGNEGWLIARTAGRSGCPLVVSLHGADVTAAPTAPGSAGARTRRRLRQAFERAAVLVAVSGFIRERAIEWGADPAKVVVQPIGIPLPQPVAIDDPQWDCVFVGRFVAKKGAGDLVAALALIDPRVRPRCLFIGDGPLEAQVRQRAADLGVDATFLGAQPPATVRHHLARARVFVAPSRTAPNGDAEGLPTTVLEASAHALPVVAYRHSGIPEAVEHDRTGLLCAEGDVEQLAAHLARLLDDDQLAGRLGRAGRERVERDFDITRCTAELEHLYDSVLARSTTAVTSVRCDR